MKSSEKNWREEGVHRTTLELPVSLWRELKAEAERSKTTPSQLIRDWLDSRLAAAVAERTDPVTGEVKS